MYGLKTPAISRLWKNTKFVCLHHNKAEEETQIMTPYEQNGKIFYRCASCGFMIPYYEIEKVIDKIIKLLTEDDDEDVSLKNYKWSAIEKNVGIKYEYRILAHRGERITVGIKKIPL